MLDIYPIRNDGGDIGITCLPDLFIILVFSGYFMCKAGPNLMLILNLEILVKVQWVELMRHCFPFYTRFPRHRQKDPRFMIYML